MIYLFSKILLCLAVAAGLGGFIGWLLRGAGLGGRIAEVESSWRQRLDTAEKERLALSGERDRLVRENASIKSLHSGCRPRIDALEADLEAARRAHDDYDDEIARLKADIKTLESEYKSRDEEANDLSAELEASTETAAQLERKTDALTDRLEKDIAATTRADSSRARELEAKVAALEKRLGGDESLGEVDLQLPGPQESGAAAPPERRRKRSGKRAGTGKDADAAKRVEATKPESEDEAPSAGLLDAPRGEPDNLKKIKGVGPVLEGRLNALGVFHFRQIASWRRSDVAWVASRLETFPDRIERDDWVTQAAELDRARDAAR